MTKGTRHRATRAAETLLDGEAEALTRRCVEMAMADGPTAMRLIMERLLPPRRDRPVCFALPLLKTPDDAAPAMAALAQAVAGGELTPAEAMEFGRLVEAFVRALEARDLARRVAELEERFDAERARGPA